MGTNSAAGVRILYLRLSGLDTADTRLVEVFLRFAGRSERHQWTLTTGERADLVLALAPESALGVPATARDPLTGAPCAWLLDPTRRGAAADPFVIRRPLQIDAFSAVLRAREAQIDQHANAAAAASSAPARGPVGVPSLSPVPVTPVATRLPSAPSPALRALGAPAPVAASDGRVFVHDDRYAWRLLKWPAADVLRDKPRFVRMLGFLANRPLSVERLMILSGVDEAGCVELLTLLDERGLLLRRDSIPMAAHPSRAAEISAVDPGPARSQRVPELAIATPEHSFRAPDIAEGGLLQRLRKRLGLS